MYDYAIIGAGINGTFMAHYLTQASQKVAIIDQSGIAGGGSGAAGAFLAPKVGKGGPLEAIVNEAYNYAINYYYKHFPELLVQKGLLHLPKHYQEPMDALKVPATKPGAIPHRYTDPLCEQRMIADGRFFETAGIIEPRDLCQALAQHADFILQTVDELDFKQDCWVLNGGSVQARHLILASGAHTISLYGPSVRLRPVWGERIEVRSSPALACNYHRGLSVSATKDNGTTVIGATHVQHKFEGEPTESGVQELIQKAKELLHIEIYEVLDRRSGVRSGSFDYFPLVGPVVDEAKSLKQYPQLAKGMKVEQKSLCYYPNLTMINGVGGRGFVLAPLLAKQLSDYLLHGSEINEAILPSRLFLRWAKKHAQK